MSRKIFSLKSNASIVFTDGGWNGGAIQDMGVLEDRQHFSLDEDTVASLPAQPELSDFRESTAEELVALRKSSPMANSIRSDVVASIRAKYTIDDELKAMRTGDIEVQGDIAALVQVGRDKMAQLGL